ncbi:MAG TPA: polyhydroxyalkanoate synthesis regulator DNA-binding domain-containing protein [Myxococcota bacterium]|jgi:polyhydroxyalkanoate synthesis repressor PhaR
MADLAPVVLKKYGNRRLYDTNASRYITLHEVEEMVQRGTDVQVLDAKTGDDLTKEILVQIILDKDSAREMLPTGFLKQVVKLSASPLKETFSRTLQDALDGFLGGQRALMDAQRALLSQVATSSPMQFANGWNPMNPFAAFAGPPPAPAAQQQQQQQQQQQAQAVGEVDRLRAEVSETQALLRQLIAQQQPKPVAAKKRRAAR